MKTSISIIRSTFAARSLQALAIAGLFFTILLAGRQSLAQKLSGDLPEEQQLQAELYFEALEFFQRTMADYSQYFADFEPELLDLYQISFDRFSKGLKKGTYAKHPGYLQTDIEQFIEHLEQQEARLSDSDDRSDRKLYRRIKGLRRELAIVLDLLEDNSAAAPVAAEGYSEDIQNYIKNLVKLDQLKITAIRRETSNKQFEKAMEQYLKSLEALESSTRLKALVSLEGLKALEGLDLSELKESSEELTAEQQEAVLEALEGFQIQYTNKGERVITFTPGLADPPEPPEPPQPLSSDKTLKTSGRAGSIVTRSFSGSLDIQSEQMPVYIIHPLGQLNIEGWSEDIVSAELEIQVGSESEKDKKSFLTGIRLSLGQDKDGYYVETILPALVNPNTYIASSILNVKVPSYTRVNCDHGFGSLKVTGLEDGVLVQGNNSIVTITGVSGKIKVENNQGPVTINNAEGPIQVNNKQGKVFLTACIGRSRVKNTVGLISVTDSEGDLSLVNSGPISVVHHSGSVDIENRNGTINVLDIDGNLNAFSSLQPLTVENVSGHVVLENRNASINVYRVEESLEVRNSHSTITVSGAEGSFVIWNENGEVFVDLSEDLRGYSTITSTSGDVQLILPDDADLLLNVVAVDGRISSDYPAEVVKDGEKQTLNLELGSDGEKLQVDVNHAKVVIKKQ